MKKTLSLLLAFLMIFSVLPISAFAEDEQASTPSVVFQEEEQQLQLLEDSEPTLVSESLTEYNSKGSGTQEDPYILETPEQLLSLSNVVRNNKNMIFKGVYFKFSDDIESITLPENWLPIGTPLPKILPTGDVVYMKRPFAGNIDGNGKTLIVPNGSLSLIGAPNGCTIEHLNIFGEKIPGYGLIEGYTTGCTATINDVTIKSGSHILKSGLVGGYGNESVNILNCTVEKGVVIGDDGSWGELGDTVYTYAFVGDVNHQDMIGSFCGAWNGNITNCVSYATVYGRNYVGGIAGFKGQSMRSFFVNDCAFYGDIIATGEGVGALLAVVM